MYMRIQVAWEIDAYDRGENSRMKLSSNQTRAGLQIWAPLFNGDTSELDFISLRRMRMFLLWYRYFKEVGVLWLNNGNEGGTNRHLAWREYTNHYLIMENSYVYFFIDHSDLKRKENGIIFLILTNEEGEVSLLMT